MTYTLNRRDLLKGTALTLGAATLLRNALVPSPALAQEGMSPGTVHSFATGGVTCSTAMSHQPKQCMSPRISLSSTLS